MNHHSLAPSSLSHILSPSHLEFDTLTSLFMISSNRGMLPVSIFRPMLYLPRGASLGISKMLEIQIHSMAFSTRNAVVSSATINAPHNHIQPSCYSSLVKNINLECHWCWHHLGIHKCQPSALHWLWQRFSTQTLWCTSVPSHPLHEQGHHKRNQLYCRECW